MMLIEETEVPESVLPVAALRDHLRLGSGFAEDSLQDAILRSFLRAAISAVEGRTGKTLFMRNLLLKVVSWRSPTDQPMTVAPIRRLAEVRIVAADGSMSVLDATQVKLLQDEHVPVLLPVGRTLPAIPAGGWAEIRFTAGCAQDWKLMPPDLAQAVMLLAAHYYEFRNETALGNGCMPFGVTALIDRYRQPLRLALGGRS